MPPAERPPAEFELLFVYGTLRRRAAHPKYQLLAQRAESLGRAWLAGRLYDAGRFPAAIDPPGGGEDGGAGGGAGGEGDQAGDDRVIGELYRLGDPYLLAELDAYEGCGPTAPRPHRFRRERRPVTAVDGTVRRAWVYLYDRPVDDLPRIAGGDFLAEPG